MKESRENKPKHKSVKKSPEGALEIAPINYEKEPSCGALCPNTQETLGIDEKQSGCMFPSGHTSVESQHVFRRGDDKYLTWSFDEKCVNCDCTPDNQCFSYGFITKKEFIELKRTTEEKLTKARLNKE
jgi:hypothetical protein